MYAKRNFSSNFNVIQNHSLSFTGSDVAGIIAVSLMYSSTNPRRVHKAVCCHNLLIGPPRSHRDGSNCASMVNLWNPKVRANSITAPIRANSSWPGWFSVIRRRFSCDRTRGERAVGPLLLQNVYGLLFHYALDLILCLQFEIVWNFWNTVVAKNICILIRMNFPINPFFAEFYISYLYFFFYQYINKRKENLKLIYVYTSNFHISNHVDNTFI